MQFRDMNLMHFIFRYPFKNNDVKPTKHGTLKKKYYI